MRRSNLLRLVGCDATTLDNLTRRDALPFPGPERRWTTYSYDHVFQLGLALELAGAGCDQRLAAAQVRAGYSDLLAAAAATSSSRQDVRFGFVVDFASDGEEAASGIMPLIGRPAQLAAMRREYKRMARAQRGFLRGELTINATYVLSAIKGRSTYAERTSDEMVKLSALFGVKG